MAVGIVLIGLPKIAVGIDLQHTHVGIGARMRADGAQGAGMLSRQRHKKLPQPHVRLHELLNSLHGLAIDQTIQV